MSGFSEDARIRHKNEKFAEAFDKKKKDDIQLKIGEALSLSYLIEVLREKGLKVQLQENNVMVITADDR